MKGDADNIVKLIVDALSQHIYIDDPQVERVVVQKFEPDNVFEFASPQRNTREGISDAEAAGLYSCQQRPFRGPGLTTSASEVEVLRSLIPSLEAEGFEVFVKPRPPLLPPFLRGFSPDAIAIRDDKKLLVEIVGEASRTNAQLERLQRLVKDQPGWELRVVLVSPANSPESLVIQSPDAILERVAEMRQLIERGSLGAAFLLGWAAFEAAARSLMPDEFRKPQTPERLVGLLAEAGHLTPSEADRLRQLAKARNAFVHGELGVHLAAEDVRQLITALEMLVDFSKAPM
jgi:uncharacterized protein YutE (UPF0331/DUF86 family)